MAINIIGAITVADILFGQEKCCVLEVFSIVAILLYVYVKIAKKELILNAPKITRIVYANTID